MRQIHENAPRTDPETTEALSVLLVHEPGEEADMIARSVPVPATVWKAPSPWAALQLIRRRPGAFGLVIVCEALGSMDPVDFLRRMRTAAPSLPAILVSVQGAGAVLVPVDDAAAPSDLTPERTIHDVWRRFRGRPKAA